MRKYFCTAFCMLCFLALGFAQELGKPYILSYNRKDYKAENQNWQIAQDKSGVMYFGNYGLLSFDANSWELMPEVQKNTVRSLAIDDNGRIYIGANGDFGYLDPADNGRYKYVSLLDSLPARDRGFRDVWSVNIAPEGVYFQTVYKLFRLEKNGRLVSWKTSNSYHRSFYVDGKLYLRQEGLGLTYLEHDRFMLVNGSAMFQYLPVSAMIPVAGSNKILIGSRNKGLFIFRPDRLDGIGAFEPVGDKKTDAFLKEHQIYHGISLRNGGYAFGTANGGILILKPDFSFNRIIDDSQGLASNSVTYLAHDAESNLWATSDGGISEISMLSPISLWEKHGGIKGAVSKILRHKGELYVTTAQGMYCLDHETDFFYPIKGIGSQCGDLIEFEGKNGKTLLVATNDGIFEVKDKKAQIMHAAKVFSLHNFALNPDRLYIGKADGVFSMIYDRTAGRWKEEGYVLKNEINGAVQEMFLDKENQLWFITFMVPNPGLFKVTLDVDNPKKHQYLKIKKFEDDQLPQAEAIQTLDGKPYFYAAKKWYSYQREKDVFKQEKEVFSVSNDTSYQVLYATKEDSAGLCWVIALQKRDRHFTLEANKSACIAKARRNPDNSYEFLEKPFTHIPDNSTMAPGSGLSRIAYDEGNLIWFAGDFGLQRYDKTAKTDLEGRFYAQIRKVFISGDSLISKGVYYETGADSVRYVVLGQPQSLIPKIDYLHNSLTFHFAAPHYESDSRLYYKYKLEGADAEWSEWGEDTKVGYTFLHEKKYTFRLLAQNSYGEVSEEATYSFEIKPPLYRTAGAFIGYFVAGILLVWGATALKAKKMAIEKKELETIVLKRTYEITKQNAMLQHQKEKIEGQADKLQKANAQISLKSAEIELQHEEITAQRDMLSISNDEILEQKEQIQKSLNNIKLLGEISSEMSSKLSVLGIIESVQNYLRDIMEADVFAIGIINTKKDCMEFKGALEMGQKLPAFSEPLANTGNSLSAYCAATKQVVVINDFETEINNYLDGFQPIEGELPKSLMFVPLIANEKMLGIITVQSYNKNAYEEHHLFMLKNIAYSAAISLDNAYAYQQLNEQNVKVKDSINYAKRIQTSILPKMELIQARLPETCLLFKPRDVVSGDFYYFTESANGDIVLGAIDCTGHGVPGGFMSMIAYELLNGIVKAEGITLPSQICKELHEGVVRSLNQQTSASNDGMDLTLCRIRLNEGTMEVAGAANPLFLLNPGREEPLIEIKTDKLTIGGLFGKDRNFKDHTVFLQTGDVVYLSSDGYYDQFGGDKGRKYTKKSFKELLLKMQSMPFEEHGQELARELGAWMGSNDQLDDILVIGVRFGQNFKETQNIKSLGV